MLNKQNEGGAPRVVQLDKRCINVKLKSSKIQKH